MGTPDMQCPTYLTQREMWAVQDISVASSTRIEKHGPVLIFSTIFLCMVFPQRVIIHFEFLVLCTKHSPEMFQCELSGVSTFCPHPKQCAEISIICQWQQALQTYLSDQSHLCREATLLACHRKVLLLSLAASSCSFLPPAF